MPKIIGEKISKEIIMDLNIPFKVYIYLLLIILLVVIIKYFFSKEEIFDFIEKKNKETQSAQSVKVPNEDTKLNLLTKLNTKINRDYLDNSKYYHKVGLSKIYGSKKEENTLNNTIKSKLFYKSAIENKSNMVIKKRRKVSFSNNIIYENDNHLN